MSHCTSCVGQWAYVLCLNRYMYDQCVNTYKCRYKKLTTQRTKMMRRSRSRPPTMATAIFQISTPFTLGVSLSAFTYVDTCQSKEIQLSIKVKSRHTQFFVQISWHWCLLLFLLLQPARGIHLHGHLHYINRYINNKYQHDVQALSLL